MVEVLCFSGTLIVSCCSLAWWNQVVLDGVESLWRFRAFWYRDDHLELISAVGRSFVGLKNYLALQRDSLPMRAGQVGGV